MLDPARWPQLSPQFDELLALSPAEREARLAAVQCSDPALAQDLRQLLQAHHDASRDGFLGAPIETGWLAGDSVAGDTLGPWTLVDVVGEGGMGRVWRARRNDGRFDGEAAIKMPRVGLADPTARARFQREGAILGGLRHPGIAQLLDAGVTATGQPYLVLEFVHGERIDRWCQARSLDVRGRVELFLQVLDAVSAAHAQLVIHRDLKPSNILVDGDGRVKLLDFGIARLIAEDHREDTQLTRAGGAALTPRYAAPEQLSGKTLTTAADVYALGVVLCELLTGRHPSGLTETASAMDYLQAATERDAQRASALAPQRRQALRGDLDNILAKALQAEPGARYASASALADELRRYLRHEPVQARTSTWHYRLGRTVRRRPLEAGLTVALVLSLAVGSVVALLQAREARMARDRALQELAASEAANEFISTLLSESGGKAFTTTDLLKRADTVLARDSESPSAVRARLHLLVGDLWGGLADFDRAHAALQTARAAAAEATDPRLLAQVDCTLAHVEAPRGDAAGAVRRFDAALATLRAGGPDSTRTLASCVRERADIAGEVERDWARSLRLAQEAVSLLQQSGQYDRRQRVALLWTMARAQSNLAQLPAAVASYEEGLALLQSMGRGQSVFAGNMWNGLGVAYSRVGLPRKALEAYDKVDEIDRGVSGEAQSNPTFNTNRAKLLDELGRPAEAVPLLLSAVEGSRGGANRLAAFWAATLGAPAFCNVGDVVRCASLLDEAQALMKVLFQTGNAAYANWNVSAARLALARGDPAAALQRLEAADAIFVGAKSKSAVRIRALALQSRLYLQQGRRDPARATAQRLDELARELASSFPQSAWLGITLMAQARLKHADGDAAGAEALRAQAVEQLRATLGDEAPETREASAPLSKS